MAPWSGVQMVPRRAAGRVRQQAGRCRAPVARTAVPEACALPVRVPGLPRCPAEEVPRAPPFPMLLGWSPLCGGWSRRPPPWAPALRPFGRGKCQSAHPQKKACAWRMSAQGRAGGSRRATGRRQRCRLRSQGDWRPRNGGWALTEASRPHPAPEGLSRGHGKKKSLDSISAACRKMKEKR